VLHQGRWPPRGDDEIAIYPRQADYVVERATTRVEALVRMRRRLADPVVLDLELLLLSGVELIAKEQLLPARTLPLRT
jgi:DNA-binding response OmpR family regulator